MNQAVLQLLRCPNCHTKFTPTIDGKSCYCSGKRRHCFDFSKSGYLNLVGSQMKEGDSKEAIQARTLFLESGFYQPLADEICSILRKIPSEYLLDAGCGEGYYTNQFAADGREVLGVDLSKSGIDYAARRAKKRQNGVGFAVASLFDLPVGDSSLDVVTNLFAPCAEEEFLRVLKPEGHLLLIGAGKNHLMGLKRAVYDQPYQNEGRSDLPKAMEKIHSSQLHYEISLNSSEQIKALFSMTPYYWRTSLKDRLRLDELQTLTTELEFDIFLFRKGPQ